VSAVMGSSAVTIIVMMLGAQLHRLAGTARAEEGDDWGERLAGVQRLDVCARRRTYDTSCARAARRRDVIGASSYSCSRVWRRDTSGHRGVDYNVLPNRQHILSASGPWPEGRLMYISMSAVLDDQVFFENKLQDPVTCTPFSVLMYSLRPLLYKTLKLMYPSR